MTLTCPVCAEPLELQSLSVQRGDSSGLPAARCDIEYRCKSDRLSLSRVFFNKGRESSSIDAAAEAGWWPMPAEAASSTEAAYERAVDGVVDAIERIAKITGEVADLTDRGHALNPDEVAQSVRDILASLLRWQARPEQEKEGERT